MEYHLGSDLKCFIYENLSLQRRASCLKFPQQDAIFIIKTSFFIVVHNHVNTSMLHILTVVMWKSLTFMGDAGIKCTVEAGFDAST